ncbi:MAG TPA: hypothetical protein VE033_08460 [Acetobacteraceae bacterium]|nr:hypothetical protein [Acetobacteraceae bacterium]
MALISEEGRLSGRTFGNTRLLLALSWAGPHGIGRVWLACNGEPLWMGSLFDAVRALARLSEEWEAARSNAMGLDLGAALGRRALPRVVVGGRPRLVREAGHDDARAVTFADAAPALTGFAQALADGLRAPLCEDIGGPRAVACWEFVAGRPAPAADRAHARPVLSDAPPVELAAMRREAPVMHQPLPARGAA